MRVLTTFPPRYDEINRRFNVRGKPVIFTFGTTIFNPGRIKIPPELMVHEEVHSRRQGDAIDEWWTDYILDPHFRLCEELPAHVAEYADFSRRIQAHTPQQRALHRIAARLSGPLYDGMIEYREARRRIEEGAHAILAPVSTAPTGGNIMVGVSPPGTTATTTISTNAPL